MTAPAPFAFIVIIIIVLWNYTHRPIAVGCIGPVYWSALGRSLITHGGGFPFGNPFPSPCPPVLPMPLSAVLIIVLLIVMIVIPIHTIPRVPETQAQGRFGTTRVANDAGLHAPLFD